MFKGYFVLCLLSSLACCQLQVSLHHQINQMITGEVGIGHLANFAIIHGQHYATTIDVSQLNDHCNWVSQLGHIGWNINPYGRFRSLYFGANSKVSTLTFMNHINTGGAGLIVSNAILGVRSGNSITMVSAYGIASVNPIPQFNQQVVQKCHKTLFHKKCHDEVIYIPRGFHQHELEAIIQESERRAAIAMRQSLGYGETGPELSTLALGSAFIHEHNQLRSLYPEIEYQYNDLESVQNELWNDVLWHNMNGMGDQAIRDRIFQFVATVPHANFIFAGSDKHLYYLIVHNNGNGTFNLHVSLFIVGAGGRLPVGAFATSQGGWSLERGGEGANPSIWQILAIFGYK